MLGLKKGLIAFTLLLCGAANALQVQPPTQSILGGEPLEKFGSAIALSEEYAAVESAATGAVDVYRLENNSWFFL